MSSEPTITEHIQAAVVRLKDATGVAQAVAIMAQLIDLQNERLQEIQAASRYQDSRSKRLFTMVLDEKIRPLIDEHRTIKAQHHTVNNLVQGIVAANFDLKVAIEDAVKDQEIMKQEFGALLGRVGTIEDALDQHIEGHTHDTGGAG